MTKHIAIVGGGAAGLAAAYALRHRARLTLYEPQAHTGGHARTVQARHPCGNLPADIGFMVFNRRNYPRFCHLLQQLGISGANTDMSFSMSHDALRLTYNGGSLPGLLAQPRNLARPLFWRLLASILRFNRIAKRAAANAHTLPATQTLENFLSRHRFSPLLGNAYLLPMGAAIWSCAPAQLAQTPARFVLAFFNNHGLLDLTNRPQWQHIPGGSATYTAALIRAIPNLRLHRRAVTAIAVTNAAPAASAVITDSTGKQETYDAVIIAAHAPDALALLAAPTAAQQSILSAFRVNHSRAILHTDAALLPVARRAHAAWNYRICTDANGGAHTSVTYHLSKLQHLPTPANAPLLLTLGVPAHSPSAIADAPPAARPNPDTVLGVYDFAHPLPDAAALHAQTRFDDLNQSGNLFFCGAYWRNGFHEDAVVSGEQTATHAARFLQLPPADTATT